MAKKRGGQPGNANALKHGFYSSTFNPKHLSDLDTELRDGLLDEIGLMRVKIRSLAEATKNEQGKEQLSDTLFTIGAAATRLAGLIRTHEALQHRSSDIAQVISDAISEAANELGLGKRFGK